MRETRSTTGENWVKVYKHLYIYIYIYNDRLNHLVELWWDSVCYLRTTHVYKQQQQQKGQTQKYFGQFQFQSEYCDNGFGSFQFAFLELNVG